MRRLFSCVFLMSIVSFTALADPEDGDELCSDGLDNDFDGQTDCSELACRSSRGADSECGVLPGGPVRATPTAESPAFVFDPVAIAVPDTASVGLFPTNHQGSRADLLLMDSTGAAKLFRQQATPGRISFQANSSLNGAVLPSARFASGPFDGATVSGLVAVNATTMQRYTCATTGVCTPVGTANTSDPGPRGGFPAVVPNTIAVANTRLRLYDSRCTRKPSSAEPVVESTAVTSGTEPDGEGTCAEGCSMADDEEAPRGAAPPVCRRADLGCLEG